MKEPIWIDSLDALALLDRVVALFGGAEGIRDDALVDSALAGTIEMAAAYTAGIVRNHPFVDGNKRTAFLIGVLFLALNGFRFSATEEDAARAVIDLTSGEPGEAGYSSFLQTCTRRV